MCRHNQAEARRRLIEQRFGIKPLGGHVPGGPAFSDWRQPTITGCFRAFGYRGLGRHSVEGTAMLQQSCSLPRLRGAMPPHRCIKSVA